MTWLADACLVASFALLVSGAYVLAGVGWALVTAGVLVGWVGMRAYR
jgi:uncharacterized membrane protein